MKEQKRLLKRAGALALALAMTLTMGQSFNSYAQDDAAVSADERQAVSETPEVQQGKEAAAEEETAAKEETVQGEEAAAEEETSGQDETAGGEDPSDQESASEGAEENVTDIQPEEKVTGEDNPEDNTKDNVSIGKQSDITKPVIEKIEFLQQGQTLKEGDTVEIDVYAHDIDSGISNVRVTLLNGYALMQLPFSFDEEKKCYVCKWKLENVGSGKVVVSQVEVIDTYGNNVFAEVFDNSTHENRYWFNIDAEDVLPQITDFQFPMTNQTVEVGQVSSSDIVLHTKETVEASEIIAYFKADDGDYYKFKLENDGSGNTFACNGYSNSIASDQSKPKEFVLQSIYTSRFGGNLNLQLDNAESYKFTVEYPVKEDEEAPVVTSIELDKNGQIVRADDQVTITVKATDNNKLSSYGFVYMKPAASIATSGQYVELRYDEQEGAYHGTFKIQKDTYPCEWFVESISIYDEASNYADINASIPGFSGKRAYYVNVYNEDTFVNPVNDVTISFLTKSQTGEWTTKELIHKEDVARRFSLKELGISLPEVQSEIDGVTQVGWLDEYENSVAEDTEFLNKGSISIYAGYDKVVVPVGYSYLNKAGKWKCASEKLLVDKGTTFGEAIKNAKTYLPEDILDEYSFEGWKSQTAVSENTVISSAGNVHLWLDAKYSEKKLIVIEMSYYDEEGCMPDINEREVLVIDKNTTGSEAMKMLKDREMPKMYPGLRVKEWKIPDISSQTDLSDINHVYIKAIYENCLVRYKIDPVFEKNKWGVDVRDQDLETIVCQVAEKGEELTIPTSFDGYDDVTWTYRECETDTFTVKHDMDFNGYGTKTSVEEPSEPDQPDTPSEPERPDTPEEPQNPGQGIQLPESIVDEVVDIVNKAEEGKDVQINMGSATVVPAKVLEAAKGKNVDVKLDMGGYTWTINGKDILADNLKDINLEVKTNVNAISSKVVKELAGDNPTKQLSLTHNGDFGFKAQLTINMGSEFAGKFGNLYYYDSDGKMVFMNAGKINDDGTVNLSFSHASDYIVVINDKKMNQADVPSGLQPENNDTGGTNHGQNKTDSVKTGDSANVLPLLLMILLAAGVIACCGIRMKKREK